MIRHKLLTVDYVFFYISLILIAWMLASNFVNKKVDDSYAVTLKARAGYEVREYTAGMYIGDEIEFNEKFWWKEIDDIKNKLYQMEIEFFEYPYFIRYNFNGTKEVFFRLKNNSAIDFMDTLSVAFPLRDAAFIDMYWYPTKKSIEKTKNKLMNALDQSDVSYNQDQYWVEIKSNQYVIPFMMQNGVFIDIKEK